MTRDSEEEFLLELLKEPSEAPEEPTGDAEPGESVEPEAEAVEAGEGVLEYNVGPVTYLVSEELYRVVEPGLDPEIARAAEAVAEYLAKRGMEPTRENIASAAEKLGLAGVAQRQLEAFTYHVEKRLSPWGFLYPLVIDPDIEEISVVAGRPVDIIHRRIPGREYIPTNIVAPPEYELREYLQRLASAAGTAISPAFPIAEAELDGHRLTMVLGSIASTSTLSIRKHPEKPLSLEDLVADGMLSREAADYLLEVLRNRGMVFIVGHQGTGKTTLLNALMEKLPPDWKLVAIEDVPELRPRHLRFVSLRIRKARSLAASKSTEITYQDLIRVALRLRGQFTAITEARGPEILNLFEVAALGEASAATFHARDWRELKLRLLKLGVREDMLSLLWAVVVLDKVKLKDGRTARRVLAIYEVLPDGSEQLLYRYDSEKDVLVKMTESRRLISQYAQTTGDGGGGASETVSGQEDNSGLSAGRSGSLYTTNSSGDNTVEELSGPS